VLVGISRDTVVSHRNFAAVHELRPPLIADPDGSICMLLGILPDPQGHPKRTTFIIDKAGVVRYIFESVKVPGHAQEVLETVREMNSQL
jgi:thioredoxin-dependent peroxiredoxin